MLLVQAVAAFLSLNIQEFAAVSHFELSLQVTQPLCVPVHQHCFDSVSTSSAGQAFSGNLLVHGYV